MLYLLSVNTSGANTFALHNMIRWIGALFGLAPIEDSPPQEPTSMKQRVRPPVAVKLKGGLTTTLGIRE